MIKLSNIKKPVNALTDSNKHQNVLPTFHYILKTMKVIDNFEDKYKFIKGFYFALINDIVQWSVMPQEYVKDMFYLQYSAYTGKEISLADNSKTSVSDVNVLIDLVIDFMFEWNVPFKEGYKQLPREEQYFIYQCCRHRRCLVCGDYADIHHLDTVGMGMNRDHVDHTQKHVMPLCRTHHENYHQLGAEKFAELYHVPVNGIKLDVETLKKLGVKGNYESQ